MLLKTSEALLCGKVWVYRGLQICCLPLHHTTSHKSFKGYNLKLSKKDDSTGVYISSIKERMTNVST